MSKSSIYKVQSDLQAEALECSDTIDAINNLASEEDRNLTEAEIEMQAKAANRADEILNQLPAIEKAAKSYERLQLAKTGTDHIKAQDINAKPGGMMSVPAQIARNRSKVYTSSEECYAMGRWMGGVLGNGRDRQYCRDQGIAFHNDMSGDESDALGGYTVPTPMAATIIRLVEEFGVWRRNARTAVMSSATLDVPKYDAGLTVYYPAAQGDAITASDLTFGTVALLAKKYACLAVMSTELAVDPDAIISMTDLVTTDIAYQFARAEDTNSFLGEVANAPNIVGVAEALQAGAKVTVGGTTLGDITLPDITAMIGKVPQYSGLNPKFYMHSFTYAKILDLLTTLGGTDMRQVEAGGAKTLYGYDVEFTQCLPGPTTAVSDMVAVFGDLNMGAYSGQRRDLRIRMLDQTFAVNDQIGIQATMRADSVTHSVGDATNCGAICGLYLAAA